MPKLKIVIAGMLLWVCALSASAGPSWQSGHITNVSFVDDTILIMLDNGVPDNCAGTVYGWMMIPATAKVTKGFVTGLWLRGDLSQVSVTIYTNDRNGASFCQINQLDPAE